MRFTAEILSGCGCWPVALELSLLLEDPRRTFEDAYTDLGKLQAVRCGNVNRSVRSHGDADVLAPPKFDREMDRGAPKADAVNEIH